MDINNISYNTVLSHVFPGVILEMQMFLAASLFSPVDINAKAMAFVQANFSMLVSFGVLFFVVATILGFILDGIHHFIFHKFERTTFDIYKYLTTLERMEIAGSVLDDDLWYPYEAYANIWIAMMPGFILFPYWMHIHHFHYLFIIISMCVYLAVFIIMFIEAVRTIQWYKEVEREIIKAFQDHK